MKTQSNRKSQTTDPVPIRGRQGVWRPAVFVAILSLGPWLAARADVVAPPSLSADISVYVMPSLFGILLLIAAHGLFVAAETGLALVRTSHVRALEKHEVHQRLLTSFMADRARALAGCTLCRQTAMWWLVILSFVPSVSMSRWLADSGRLAFTLGSALAVWLIVALPIASVATVFGELVPRAYAAKNPAKALLRLGKLVRLASTVFYVPALLLTRIASLVTLRFGANASFVVENQAEEEIKSLAETAEEQGEIAVEERKLLHSVFEFHDTIAREIMTPRVDMDSVPLTATPAEIVKLVQETGRSRIPVYEDTDDQIIGIIHAKDLLTGHEDTTRVVNLRTLLRPVVFVPENKNIHDLLTELKRSRSQMAIVQDEFGGTAGLVTIEDIVEELVGEIVDEYDQETPDVVLNGSGWVVNGKLNLYDLNEEIGSDFTSEEFDTVGGYVFGLFGRLPGPGDAIEDEGYRFQIEETDGRRIQKLHVERIEGSTDRESAALF